jgi:hypothetical protein
MIPPEDDPSEGFVGEADDRPGNAINLPSRLNVTPGKSIGEVVARLLLRKSHD